MITPAGIKRAFDFVIGNQVILLTGNPGLFAYQDLNLSTDGGASFTIAIAAYLSPTQRRLTWSTVPRNATPRAKLQIILHGTDAHVSQIISDDFSIFHDGIGVVASRAASSGPEPGSPAFNAGIPQHGIAKGGVSSVADITNNSPPSGGQATQTVTPNFPGSGSCATWNVPNVTLDYSMGSIYDKCGTLQFFGEPNVAQDPVDPTHFVLLHPRSAPLRAYEPSPGYAYSPHIKVGPPLQAPPYSPVGDISTEIAADGSVYAVQVAAAPSGNGVVLIFRSTDGGLTFGNGVPLPQPAGVQFVDKPVMDVHKTNPNILAVTVNPLSNGVFTGNAYVVICTSASTLSSFTIVQPLTNSGGAVKPYGTLHPLIDPISPGSSSYWLFLVYTNDDFSAGGRTQAGMTIFQYQVTNEAAGVKAARAQPEPTATAGAQLGPPTIFLPYHTPWNGKVEVREGESLVVGEFVVDCYPNAPPPVYKIVQPQPAPDFILIVPQPCSCPEQARAKVVVFPSRGDAGKYNVLLFASACGGVGGEEGFQLKVKKAEQQ